MAIHAICKDSFPEIPDLNRTKNTLISELLETETIWVPEGWTENELTDPGWAS